MFTDKKLEFNLDKALINVSRIPKYRIHNKEAIEKSLPAKMFLFWIQKFFAELIPGWNVSVYFSYCEDDPEKRTPVYYKSCALDKWTRALSEFYSSDRVVNFAFNLSSSYDNIDNISDLFFEIGQTAFHEVLHVLCADFDKKKDPSSVHKIIVNMENNVFPYIYEITKDQILNR